MLDVTIYDEAGNVKSTFHADDGEGVDFVSLVSDDTYGKPALVAPGKPGDTRSSLEERVLYINTAFIPMFEIVRVSD